MNRRRFLCVSGACCAATAAPRLQAQIEWQAPARFVRPGIATDEGGLWALTDREETRLRRSPFLVQDPALRRYVQEIACRIAGDHCPDLRVYLVHTPLFNASMAANGMMQVWSGLLLRMENEAQFAAVVAHEVAHYVLRHVVERLRDARARTAFGQFIGLFGVVGAIGQLVTLATLFAYSREQEHEADRVGLVLMRQAGYDPAEAPRVWGNLLTEVRARPDADEEATPLFASHPAPEERRQALEPLAATMSGGVTNEEAWLRHTRPFRRAWLADEIRRGQQEESIALLTRMITRWPAQPELTTARGEIHRLRAHDADLDAAVADFRAAAAHGSEPPEAHRGLGLIYRQRNDLAAARTSFERYLELAPGAPDAPMIRSYVQDIGK